MSNVKPKWLDALLSEKFFDACIVHQEDKKNEKNLFCLDCCKAICTDCSIFHQSHHLQQVRRSVYQNVLRLEDAKELIDCDSVQPYICNKHEVVHLNKMKPTKVSSTRASSANKCLLCSRVLLDSYHHYCSIDRQFKYMMKTGEKVSEHIYWKSLLIENRGDQMTSETVIETSASGSSAAVCGGRRKRRRKGTPHRSARN